MTSQSDIAQDGERENAPLDPQPARAPASRAAKFVALVLFAGLFALYAWTAAPEITFHDAGELVTGACTLGLPHPPSAPTWCLLGYAFSRVPIGSPAFRLNLMSGLFGALACAFVYLLSLRIVRSVCSALPAWFQHLAAVFSALMLAQAQGFWGKCAQAELYTLNAAFLAALLYLFDLWLAQNPEDRPPNNRRLALIAFLFGLGTGNYFGLLWYVPILLPAVIVRRPSVLKDWRLISASAGVFALAGLVHLYLPLRSRANPPLDWGNPETLAAFASALKREWWGKLSLADVSGDFVTRYVETFAFPATFGVAALLLAGLGLVLLALRRRLLCAVLVLCFYVYGVAMTFMIAATPAVTQNLIFVTTYDLQEIHIPMYLILAIFTGAGLAACASLLGRRFGKAGAPARAVTAILALLAVALLGWRFARAYPACDYRAFPHARDYGQELLRTVPEQGWVFVFPGSDNAIFVLAYLKFCEDVRPDVTLIPPSPACVRRLASLADRAETPLTGDAIVAAVRSNPPAYLLPLFNQPGIGRNDQPPVVFANLPAHTALARQAYPHGLAFRLDGRDRCRRHDQIRFWGDLLRRPSFALRPDSKHNFRENMMQILGDHAWWHHAAGDYRLAEFLYRQAIRYAPATRPDFLAGLADSLLELGDLDQALACAREALAAEPANRSGRMVAGIALAKAGRFADAAEQFRILLSCHPGDQAAQSNLRLALADAQARSVAAPRAQPGATQPGATVHP